MRFSFFQRYRYLLLLVGILLSVLAVGRVLLSVEGTSSQTQISPTATTIVSVSSPTPTLILTPSVPAIHFKRPDFEAGITFPQWSHDGYGQTDTRWQQGLHDIQTQTGARWIEIPMLFSQDTPTSTHITNGPSTPTVESVVAGIRAAHALGYHVFVVPLLAVNEPGEWAGTIHFSTYQQEEQWFDSFWQTFEPYAEAAEGTGVEQLAIGTEEVWLQENAPASLWNTLIARVRSVFSGTIMYDMNWTTLEDPLPSWMSNQNLATIGVSTYIPLIDVQARLDRPAIFSLWRDIAKRQLDNLAIHLGKPIVISEIGFRNSADSLYHPWYPDSTTPPDPAEQAAACDAALANVIPDPHIAGIFFWGWDDVRGFKLSGQPAATVLHKWYTSPQA